MSIASNHEVIWNTRAERQAGDTTKVWVVTELAAKPAPHDVARICRHLTFCRHASRCQETVVMTTKQEGADIWDHVPSASEAWHARRTSTAHERAASRIRDKRSAVPSPILISKKKNHACEKKRFRREVPVVVLRVLNRFRRRGVRANSQNGAQKWIKPLRIFLTSFMETKLVSQNWSIFWSKWREQRERERERELCWEQSP